MSYTILVLPFMENHNLFAEIYDKIINVINDDAELKRTLAPGEDPIQCCGNKVYTQHRDPGNSDKNQRTVNTVIPGQSIIWKIQDDAGITQADIDIELARDEFIALGNGMSTFGFNGKVCTILVLQKDKTATKAKMDQVATELKRTC